ncbi:unnamed protein product, partial [Ectocarpus sp. 13 AM-2016]
MCASTLPHYRARRARDDDYQRPSLSLSHMRQGLDSITHRDFFGCCTRVQPKRYFTAPSRCLCYPKNKNIAGSPKNGHCVLSLLQTIVYIGCAACIRAFIARRFCSHASSKVLRVGSINFEGA